MSGLTPEQEQIDPLGAFLRYADRLHEYMAFQPAYTETCCCGASVQIGRDVPARERVQTVRHFIARHQHCTQPRRDADITTEEADQ